MESWLSDHVKSGNLVTENSIMLDVGAYKGDFSKQMLAESNLDKAILFEANTDNFNDLQNIFLNQDNISLFNYAVGNENGESIFHCDSDLATGSILPYKYRENDNSDVKRHQVKLIKLDSFFQTNPSSQRIALIKTDTQGYDLQVLQGAENTIANHQPWLIIELIFTPLYKNQSDPHQIISWLAERGYRLAGIFNQHYTSDPWLAYADGIFIPQQFTQAFNMPFKASLSDTQLIAEIGMLRQVCEERLQLINRLHSECAKLRKN